MCTLTFIPGLPGGGYLLAVNRDESPQRATATPPAVQQFGKRQVIAPRDPDGGGTWIGVDDSGHCIAILNGDHPLPPRMLPTEVGGLVSRGLLVHDLLEDPRFDSVRDELQRRHRLDALHHKPFKLVVVSPGPGQGEGRAAHILRGDWNGSRLAFEETSGPRCVVSSSVETEGVTNYRRAAFEQVVPRALAQMAQASAVAAGAVAGAAAGPPPAPLEDLSAALGVFHSSHHPEAPQGDARSVCMHRDEAHTVSTTIVLVTGDHVSMRYRAGQPCQGGKFQVTTLKKAR